MLWFDGDSTVNEQTILNELACCRSIEQLYVEKITPEIQKYNELVPRSQQIKVKDQYNEPHVHWLIPAPYNTLNVKQYVLDKLSDECLRVADTLNRARVQRTLMELEMYESMELFDFLRALIYIINTLQEKNIVWGVGRGSSVSSYVLYLIGVHDVDSVVYSLNIEDFLR